LSEFYRGTAIKIGAQNIHFKKEGAFTGEVSYEMLKSINVNLTIIGHSERREYFNETDETVNKKLKTVFANDISPILCVGETLEIRERKEEKKFVNEQLEKDLDGILANDIKKLTIAYEPIWAIGTGKTATEEQAEEMCQFIRKTISSLYDKDLAEMLLIQYGGSVKPENAKTLFAMPNIDGGLIGGASLTPDSFLEIIKAGI
jgi:triosephosphate isomerase